MTEHTKDRLARELRALGLDAMADKAAAGHYDDYLSPVADNIGQLCADLLKAVDAPGNEAALSKILELRQRAINGDFDGTTEESEAWAASPEGQGVMRQLATSARKRKLFRP